MSPNGDIGEHASVLKFPPRRNHCHLALRMRGGGSVPIIATWIRFHMAPALRFGGLKRHSATIAQSEEYIGCRKINRTRAIREEAEGKRRTLPPSRRPLFRHDCLPRPGGMLSLCFPLLFFAFRPNRTRASRPPGNGLRPSGRHRPPALHY